MHSRPHERRWTQDLLFRRRVTDLWLESSLSSCFETNRTLMGCCRQSRILWSDDGRKILPGGMGTNAVDVDTDLYGKWRDGRVMSGARYPMGARAGPLAHFAPLPIHFAANLTTQRPARS